MSTGPRLVEDKPLAGLIGDLLQEQAQLSAVDRFSQWHDNDASPTAERYLERMPAHSPAAGEQYAFAVDLDACTGCKACVTGCHSLNGLDEDEVWRSVGLLQGGTAEDPYRQPITTACHHCLEPACLKGCPANAYEKSAATGIVHHLDDLCIGCRYCQLTCPYDVPRFNPEQGIVRKCDMCSDRLAQGVAPACVQACPTEAIRITLVKTDDVVADSQGQTFLPTAPAPYLTLPTTQYHTERVIPRNAVALDFHYLRPADAHPTLVIMLVLTQLGAGMFAVDWLVNLLGRGFAPGAALVALAAIGIGLVSSVLHLGKPRLAYRALLGLGHSWLSREVVALGAFGGMAFLYALMRDVPAAAEVLAYVPFPPLSWVAAATAFVGLVGVYTSIRVYQVTRRPAWVGPSTLLRFGFTTTGLGALTYAAVMSMSPAGDSDRALMVLLAVAGMSTVAKLGLELSVLTELRSRVERPVRRTARLLWGILRRLLLIRVALGVVGGVLLPVAAVWFWSSAASVLLVLAVCLGLAGEFIARHLFFVSASARRMPGSLE